MSTTRTTARWTYPTDTGGNDYTYDNLVQNPADLLVTRYDVDGTSLPLPTYSVTGAGDPNGGSVHFDTDLDDLSGSVLVLERQTQRVTVGGDPADYIQDPAKTRAFNNDQRLLLPQELFDKVGRTIQENPAEATIPLVLPVPAARANQFLAFGPTGKELETRPFPSPIIISGSMLDNAISFLDPAFGARADAHQYTDGSWNRAEAWDNTAAYNAFWDACQSTRRPGKVPGGDYYFKQGNAILKTFADGVYIYGEGANSNFVYGAGADANGKHLLTLGSSTVGVCYVPPQNSTVIMTADFPRTTRVLPISAADAAQFSKGQVLVLMDPTKPVYGGAGQLMGQSGELIEIESIIGGVVTLRWAGQLDYTAASYVGYFINPVSSVRLEKLSFTYDNANSYQGGVSSMLELIACHRSDFEDILFRDACSRAISMIAPFDNRIGGIRAYVGRTGSCMTIQRMGGWVKAYDITRQGTGHGVSFGGDSAGVPAHSCSVTNVHGRGGGSDVETHVGARNIVVDGVQSSGNADGWTNDDTNMSSSVTLRGWDCEARNIKVRSRALGVEAYEGLRCHFWNIETWSCGRSFRVLNADQTTIQRLRAHDPLWNVTDITATVGPNQGNPYLTNMQFIDLQTLGTPPAAPYADLYINLNQATPDMLRGQGWKLGPISRNGGPAVFIGAGTALNMFTTLGWAPAWGWDITETGAYRTNPNLMANPAFDGWTAGTSWSLPAGVATPTADRWTMYAQQAGHAAGQAPGFSGSTWCLRLARDVGAVTTGILNSWYQLPSALVRQLAGQAIVLSCYIRAGAGFSPAAARVDFAMHTGTAGGETPNYASVGAGAFPTGGAMSQTVANTAAAPAAAIARYFVRWQVPANAADMAIRITPNTWTVTPVPANDYFELTNLKLEIGPTVTSFPPPGPL